MPQSPNSVVALPTAADVDQAARRLAGVALRTPLISSPVLDAATGARVFLKAETLQRTGSFKFRGAYNKLSSIAPEKRAGGVVAFSSGNHAQGVAHAAKLLNMPSVIVMPSDAPKPKRERTAAFGAEVVLYDREKEDREGIARALAEKRGATLVPPYDDPFIIAGQGTAGREIMEDLTALGVTPDVAVIGASGGGLAAGISLALKARAPAV
jgi:threonine dehydratase